MFRRLPCATFQFHPRKQENSAVLCLESCSVQLVGFTHEMVIVPPCPATVPPLSRPCPALSRHCPAIVPPLSRPVPPLSRPCPATSRHCPATVPPCPATVPPLSRHCPAFVPPCPSRCPALVPPSRHVTPRFGRHWEDITAYLQRVLDLYDESQLTMAQAVPIRRNQIDKTALRARFLVCDTCGLAGHACF